MPPTYVIVAIVLMAIVALILRLPPIRAMLADRPSRPTRGSLPYTARPFLLSKGEAAFYHTLKRAVEDRYGVAMKVRLSDILACPRGAWRAGHGNRIVQKHVDFVLIDPATTKILAAIELDDRSHARADRIERDGFVGDAMKAAGVPLIHFRAAAQYDSTTIATTVQQALSSIQAGARFAPVASAAPPPHPPIVERTLRA